jgi:hypothetical protein
MWKLTLGYSMLQQVLNYLAKLVGSGPCYFKYRINNYWSDMCPNMCQASLHLHNMVRQENQNPLH